MLSAHPSFFGPKDCVRHRHSRKERVPIAPSPFPIFGKIEINIAKKSDRDYNKSKRKIP